MRKFLLLFAVVSFVFAAAEVAAKPHHRVVFDSTSVVMEETGLSHVVRHVRLRPTDEVGCRDNSVVKIQYDPLSAYVEIRSVVVHMANGTDRVVDTKVYDYVAPARSIYWLSSEKMVQVGHLDLGDELEFVTYKKGFTYALLADQASDEQYIPPMRGHYYDIVPFYSSVPVDRSVYRLSILRSKQLQYHIYNDDKEPELAVKVDTALTDDRIVYTFTKSNIKPFATESSMCSPSDLFCKLLLSTAPDWQSKSVWFYKVNEDYGSFTATPELQKKVNELVAGAKTEFDSINILTHWVADNMRYSGITMGKGEGYTLHNAKTNFTDRCGVCKDKASLLIAMLRAAGFESYAAMTMAGSRIDRIPADQFNHSVSVVKLRNGNFQLIDPTWVPNIRELWSSAEQQQGYLMGLPNGADLMYTPISAPENHYIRVSGRSELKADGTLCGTFTVQAEGQSDAAVRSVFSCRPAQWQRNLELELLRLAPQARIISIKHTDNDHYLDQPVSITYTYEIPNYAVVTDDEAIFTPITARNIFSRAMSHLRIDTSIVDRQYAFRDRTSRLVQFTDTITLPATYTQFHFQPVYGVANPAASFGCRYWLEGNTLQFAETVMMGRRVYVASDWPYVRQCLRYQHMLASTPVVLTK